MMAKGTMGSALKEKAKEKVEETKKNRPEAEAGVKTPVRPNFRFKGARNDFWYRNYEGTTDSNSNEAIGVVRIDAFPASDAQFDNGVICNVRLVTVIGEISSIQIRQSKNSDEAIYLSAPSRKWEKSEDNVQWFNDVKLNREVEAQVLRYVESQLEPVE